MYFIYIVIIKFYIIDYKNQFKFNSFYKKKKIKIKCNLVARTTFMPWKKSINSCKFCYQFLKIK